MSIMSGPMKEGGWRLQLRLRHLLGDAAVLGSVFSVVVITSLWLDARLWLEDYPPDIRAAVGDGNVAPIALQIIVAVALVVVLAGGVIYSNRRLWLADPGAYGRATAFSHTFVLFWLVNVIDVVVVDWLFLVTLRPDFVVFPGTEGLAGYGDYAFHFWASFGGWRPWLGSMLISAVMALVLPWWWRRRSGPLVER